MKKKRKSRKRTFTTSFSLRTEQIEFVKALADKLEVSISQVMRDIIKEKLVS
jgi:predicted DNA-binding transcriptional regulator YafY